MTEAEQKPKQSYTPMSDEDKKKLALDIFQGRVFTDRHLPNRDLLTACFMVLGLMERKDLEHLVELLGTTGVVYEYLDNAGPRSINGFPMFLSVKFLDANDGKDVIDLVIKLQEAAQAVVGA